MRKKLLALLLAAALALGLLAGCGGGESVASALLKLLDGRYPNISIEIDPELEADLRQAIRKAEAENAGDDDAVIRAALETALGSTITFRNLRNGQQGETAFDLVFYAGSDPDKAAQAAYSQWNPILSNVPADGKYDTSLAMVETNSGVWMLVKATVEKAGTEDKPEPASVTGISVTPPTKTQYNPGEPFDPTGMKITVTYSDGSTKTISSDYSSKGVTWSPANINADTTVTITYGGKTDTVAVELITLESIEVTGPTKAYNTNDTFSQNDITVTAYYSDSNHIELKPSDYTFTITAKGSNNPIDSSEPFNTAGEYTLTVSYDNKTSNSVTIHVKDKDGYHEDSSGTYVVTGSNGLQNLYSSNPSNFATAKITLNSPVTLGASWPETISFSGELNGNGNTITMEGNRKQGLFNEIGASGLVQNVDIEVSGTISGNGIIGAVAGWNLYGTIQGCSVTGGSISGSYAGGVVGINAGSVTACYSTSAVSGTQSSGSTCTGGVVGYNYNGGTVTACYHAGTVQGGSKNGGVVGYNDGTINDCYWDNSLAAGISSGNVSGYNAGSVYKINGDHGTTWNDAVNGAEGLTGMNAAILEWNSNNPGNPCNYHYDDSKAPPELAPGAPISTTNP